MKLKKYNIIKIILLKIFISQQKNKLSFNIQLRLLDLTVLFFLWKTGHILGFYKKKSNLYKIFLKKHFQQFSMQFLGCKLSYKKFCLYKHRRLVSTSVILSSHGIISNNMLNKNIGGLLLCNIF